MRIGNFRPDMYYRLQILILHLPPLRERTEDIPELLHHLLRALNSQYLDVPPEVMDLFMSYPWPGNIREMKNILERALMLSRGGVLTRDNFSALETIMEANSFAGNTMNEIEASHMLDILKQCKGDVNKASKFLGISKSTIYRKVKRLKERN